MPDYYADSSVLVKRHVQEAGSIWFRSLCAPNAGNVILTARLSMAEVYSALNRRRREASIAPHDYYDLVSDFEMVCLQEYQFIEMIPEVMARTKHILEHYPLRVYDAVQLASAVLAQAAIQPLALSPLTFLSADERLLVAAQAEGLLSDNPNLYS